MYQQPDEKGFYGDFGGQFVPETLMFALKELTAAYEASKEDEAFQTELAAYLSDYVGRETPLYFAEQLTKKLGGAKIYLKREDLNHTGAHKINNALGQVLRAKKMGKKKIIAETGAGQHGVDRYCCGFIRYGMYDFYGSAGCQTPSLECLSDGITWFKSRKCDCGK